MANNLNDVALKILWVYDKPTHQGWNGPRINTSIHSFYWIHKGKGQFITEAGSFEVESGMLAYLPPSQKVRMISNNESPFHIIMVLFDCIAMPYKDKQWREPYNLPTLGLPFLKKFENPAASQIDNLFVQLNNRFIPDVSSIEIECKCYLLSLLSKLINSDEVTIEDNNGKYIYGKVKSQLEMFFHMDLKIGELSKSHAVSPSYLRKLFVRYAGTSPKSYLNQLRNEHALRLLLRSRETIKEVAAQCGYSDELYFSTIFKQMNGISPSDFRKKKL
jgi:AraC-type DNA-binding domain-containing proteins